MIRGGALGRPAAPEDRRKIQGGRNTQGGHKARPYGATDDRRGALCGRPAPA